MQNLNLILVLSLISFSFQSDSCLKTFKICSSDRSAVKAPYKSIDKYIVYDENGDYFNAKLDMQLLTMVRIAFHFRIV